MSSTLCESSRLPFSVRTAGVSGSLSRVVATPGCEDKRDAENSRGCARFHKHCDAPILNSRLAQRTCVVSMWREHSSRTPARACPAASGRDYRLHAPRRVRRGMQDGWVRGQGPVRLHSMHVSLPGRAITDGDARGCGRCTTAARCEGHRVRRCRPATREPGPARDFARTEDVRRLTRSLS